MTAFKIYMISGYIYIYVYVLLEQFFFLQNLNLAATVKGNKLIFFFFFKSNHNQNFQSFFCVIYKRYAHRLLWVFKKKIKQTKENEKNKQRLIWLYFLEEFRQETQRIEK